MENFERVLNSTSGTIWLMWDGSHTTAWNGGTNIQRRQRRRNDITVGTVALSDLIYIQMYNNAEQQYEHSYGMVPGHNGMTMASNTITTMPCYGPLTRPATDRDGSITAQWQDFIQPRTAQARTTPDFSALRSRM